MYGQRKLFPENPTAQEAYRATSVETMKQAIDEHANYSPFIKMIYDIAEIKGLSEDEKMIVLAFYAISRMENSQDIILKQLMLNPGTFFHGA